MDNKEEGKYKAVVEPEQPQYKPVYKMQDEAQNDAQNEIQNEAKIETVFETEAPKQKKGFLAIPITRKQYWLYVVLSYVAAIIIGIVIDMIAGDGGRNIAYYAVFAFWILLQIKRLRDANKPLTWLLLDLLSIVGIIVVGCFPSNHVNNKWAE